MAAEHAIRTEGIQALAFWELLTDFLCTQPQRAETRTAKPSALELNNYSDRFNTGKYLAYTQKATRTTVLAIAEDNEVVSKIIKKARSMALRHLPQTHRVNLHWLFEVCSNPRICMLYVNAKQQVADFMTKALNNPQVWEPLLDIAQVRGGLETEAGVSKPALFATPPGPSLPLNAACCPACKFDTTLPGSQCPCSWS